MLDGVESSIKGYRIVWGRGTDPREGSGILEVELFFNPLVDYPLPSQ